MVTSNGVIEEGQEIRIAGVVISPMIRADEISIRERGNLQTDLEGGGFSRIDIFNINAILDLEPE